MGYADIPLVNIQTGEPIPVSKPPKIKSEAGSTSAMVFGWAVVIFIAVLLLMTLVKIGIIWFG